MSIGPSHDELMRMHDLGALRDERDALRTENERLRELYENVVGNRERFGWTINHLLECEEALRTVEVVAERLRADLAEEKALREEAEQSIDHYQHEIAMLRRGKR